MITYGNGGVVFPIKNGLKRNIHRSLKRGTKNSRSSGSQDSGYCDTVTVSTNKADEKNDVGSALTTITSSPPAPEYLTSFCNELLWPHIPPNVVDGDGDGDGDGGAEWVCVDKVKDPNPFSLYDGYVFGSAPSGDEVQAAVASLQGVLDKAPSANGVKESDCDLEEGTDDQSDYTTDSSSPSASPIGSVSDWIEPSMQLCYSNMSGMLPQRNGYDRVYGALHMLQHEPMVQKMVASLSSDNTVWDAVLNNAVVREIRDSLSKAVVTVSSSVPSDAPESKSGNFLSSFIAGLKAKIEELIKSLRMGVISLVHHEGRHHEGSDQATLKSEDATELRLRVSFMLTMVVFLVVVLNRMNKA